MYKQHYLNAFQTDLDLWHHLAESDQDGRSLLARILEQPEAQVEQRAVELQQTLKQLICGSFFRICTQTWCFYINLKHKTVKLELYLEGFTFYDANSNAIKDYTLDITAGGRIVRCSIIKSIIEVSVLFPFCLLITIMITIKATREVIRTLYNNVLSTYFKAQEYREREQQNDHNVG